MARPAAWQDLAGVLYAEDFDEIGVAAASDAAHEPEMIAPSFSAAELEAARAQAREAGRVEAEQGLAASRTRMLGTLAAGMGEAGAAAREVSEALAEEVARCMLSALVACLPALCERHGAEELRSVARAVLPALRNEPRITVRVHPGMLAVMQEEVAALDAELAERIEIIPAGAIAPGDVRIGWTDGQAVRDAGRARAAVDDALAALGLLEPSLMREGMNA